MRTISSTSLNLPFWTDHIRCRKGASREHCYLAHSCQQEMTWTSPLQAQVDIDVLLSLFHSGNSSRIHLKNRSSEITNLKDVCCKRNWCWRMSVDGIDPDHAYKSITTMVDKTHRTTAKSWSEPSSTKHRLVAIAYLWAISSTIWLSFQSSFQLSLAVLVRYRSLANI